MAPQKDLLHTAQRSLWGSGPRTSLRAEGKRPEQSKALNLKFVKTRKPTFWLPLLSKNTVVRVNRLGLRFKG